MGSRIVRMNLWHISALPWWVRRWRYRVVYVVPSGDELVQQGSAWTHAGARSALIHAASRINLLA